MINSLTLVIVVDNCFSSYFSVATDIAKQCAIKWIKNNQNIITRWKKNYADNCNGYFPLPLGHLFKNSWFVLMFLPTSYNWSGYKLTNTDKNVDAKSKSFKNHRSQRNYSRVNFDILPSSRYFKNDWLFQRWSPAIIFWCTVLANG